MKKNLIVIVVFFMGIVFGLILAHGTLNAQNANSDPDVMSKLNEIAKSQQDIIGAIGSMKEDLQIIKIRITQMQ